MTELEQQLAAYTDFLEERSVARAADHTTPTNNQGDVIVVDSMERRNGADADADGSTSGDAPGNRRWLWLAVAAAVALVVATIGILNVGDEGAADLDTVDSPPAPVEAEVAEVEPPMTTAAPEPEPDPWTQLDEIYNEAVSSGDRTPLGDLFSTLMTATFDGFEGPQGSGFNAMTRAGSHALNPRTMSNCVPVDDATVVCDVSISYPMIDSIMPAHTGTITFGHDGERIMSMDEVSNRGEINETLLDYQAWSEANAPGDAALMWSGPAQFRTADDGVEAHFRVGPLYVDSLGG